MDLLTILILGAVFLFVVSIVQLFYLTWASSKLVEKRKLKKRLLSISAGGKHGKEKLTLYRKKVFGNAGPLEGFFLSIPRIARLDRLLLRSGVPINASSFVLLSLALSALGAGVGLHFWSGSVAFLTGLIGLAVPILWLRIAEQKVFNKFQEQLPEALDLLARALRSGHALSAGLEMIAKEMTAPIADEFAAVVDETNLGLTLKEALENLCERVPSQDLRFFTIAIMVQKETGGNIAEILDNISHLIRERVQFKRHVEALTAEGKVSAVVLLALPLVMFAYVFTVNYDYVSLLWLEEKGRYLLAGGIIAQIVGALIIRKIIDVEM